MEIILLEDIEKVGEKHSIVKVRDGYGRNYLIPKGMAIVANKSNRNQLDSMKRREAAVEAKFIAEYQAIADLLKGKMLKVGAKAGTSGKIFGSVTNVQIANALKEQFSVEIDRRKIIMDDDIKELGNYKVVLDLHKSLKPEVDIEVFAE
ncbi:MAG TPA: 50S ribosomal protein L9 [Flavilitoribacter sp.]|nr:50S ribosomal protein L9 [Flavilitoribacter sp.]HMQ87429.1 50S ribosomal protein L9 [Flavilitoribacter sp.]